MVPEFLLERRAGERAPVALCNQQISLLETDRWGDFGELIWQRFAH
jgi:hypothetical protein